MRNGIIRSTLPTPFLLRGPSARDCAVAERGCFTLATSSDALSDPPRLLSLFKIVNADVARDWRRGRIMPSPRQHQTRFLDPSFLELFKLSCSNCTCADVASQHKSSLSLPEPAYHPLSSLKATVYPPPAKGGLSGCCPRHVISHVIGHVISHVIRRAFRTPRFLSYKSYMLAWQS